MAVASKCLLMRRSERECAPDCGWGPLAARLEHPLRVLARDEVRNNPAPCDTVYTQLHRPVVVDGQRASALRFGEPRV